MYLIYLLIMDPKKEDYIKKQDGIPPFFISPVADIVALLSIVKKKIFNQLLGMDPDYSNTDSEDDNFVF